MSATLPKLGQPTSKLHQPKSHPQLSALASYPYGLPASPVSILLAFSVESLSFRASPNSWKKTLSRKVDLGPYEGGHQRSRAMGPYYRQRRPREGRGTMIDQLHPDSWTDPSRGRELATAQYLGYAYVPVVRWAYNIYTKVAAQTLRIPLPLGEYTIGGYGVQTASVAVRERSSWGEEDLE